LGFSIQKVLLCIRLDREGARLSFDGSATPGSFVGLAKLVQFDFHGGLVKYCDFGK